MMILPPIDELASRTNGNKYLLACIMSKRAKELEKRIPEELAKSDNKSVSWAAFEIFDKKIIVDTKNL